MDSSGYDVFISYKRKTGEDFARHLKEGLEEEHISAFLDVADIPRRYKGTTEWGQFLDRAISTSRLFLLIITDGIESSSEVVREVKCAQNNNVDFALLRHKGLKPEMALNLGEKVLDLSKLNQVEFDTKEDLLRKILRILGEQSKITMLQKAPLSASSISEKGNIKKDLKLQAYSTEEIIGELEDFQVDMLRGNWFLKKENYDKAVDLYDRALIAKPDCIECLVNKAVALDSLGKREEAFDSLDRAFDIKPSAYILGLKATILGSQGRYEEAITVYDKSIEMMPTLFAYYNKAHYLSQLKRYDEAIPSYDKAIEIDSGDSDPWHGKAFALFQLGKFTDAINCCDRAISIESSPTSLNLKGFLLINLNLFNDAKLLYEQVLRTEPENTTALIGLSETFLVLGNYREGLEKAKKAFHLSKNKEARVFSWLLSVSANYFLNDFNKARNETKRLLDYLKFERHFLFQDKIFSFSTLVRLAKEKLKGKEKADLLSLISLLRGKT